MESFNTIKKAREALKDKVKMFDYEEEVNIDNINFIIDHFILATPSILSEKELKVFELRTGISKTKKANTLTVIGIELDLPVEKIAELEERFMKKIVSKNKNTKYNRIRTIKDDQRLILNIKVLSFNKSINQKLRHLEIRTIENLVVKSSTYFKNIGIFNEEEINEIIEKTHNFGLTFLDEFLKEKRKNYKENIENKEEVSYQKRLTK